MKSLMKQKKHYFVVSSEIVKEFYVAFKKNDFNTCQKLCNSETEWITIEEISYGGTFKGVKEIFENYFPNMLKNFKEFNMIPDQITTLKDHVMVNGKYQGISKIGKKFNVEFSHIYLIKNNKIIQFRQFTDTKIIQESLK